ncbi:MAG: prolyl oligopeptidase family serine peptidase [Ignavibacteriae bacterium]|nr:prolyl oligopeptidase family serine peptidase [Ignavibacteriota bacterium]
MKKIILALITILSTLSFAQEQIIVNKGLLLKINPPGRRSLSQVDPIESKIVNDKWTEPKENEKFEFDTIKTNWIAVNADDKGWFSNENEWSGSYLYYKYESNVDKIMLLQGFSYYNVFVNGEPRIGNVYGTKENYESWEPNFNNSFLPVKIKKGKNEFLFQMNYGRMKAVLREIKSEAFFNLNDITLPDVFKNEPYNDFGGIIVINAQNKTLKNAVIKVTNSEGREVVTEVPDIIPVSLRKVKFNFSGMAKNNDYEILKLQLIVNGKVTDEQDIKLKCAAKFDAYKQTFLSSIDGSVQYYAVKPSTNTDGGQSLFLSVHGASVEAINQAGSYSNKEWGNIVCPTNRRPYGFNWEDIGRIDAMEVLNIAKQKFHPDENRIYLTGHSMGGHGTWYLGVNYPDQFAAIGPSAGWISLWSYRFDGISKNFNSKQKLYTKAAKQSDTYSLAHNFSNLGIYILHGDADSVVSPFQARSMIRTLNEFHKDFDYHFEPGMEHWWDIDTVKEGSDCVDWAPMFDFFARHARSLDRVKKINFTTASPGISSKNYWVTVEQQNELFELSNVDIEFVPFVNIFRIKTKNVKTLSIDCKELGLIKGTDIVFEINDEKLNGKIENNKIYLTNNGKSWEIKNSIDKNEKSPVRYGTFKDLYRDSLVFVYGTKGTDEQNEQILAKVRYDSEMFWYVGNGAVEIIADVNFNPDKYQKNNILLYGNSDQNSAFKKLLKDSPVKINNSGIEVDKKKLNEKDLACYFIYPKKGSEKNLIGVIGATGDNGMKLSYLRPFLKPGSSFPDVTVFNKDILVKKDGGLSLVGLFGLDWSVKNGEFIFE